MCDKEKNNFEKHDIEELEKYKIKKSLSKFTDEFSVNGDVEFIYNLHYPVTIKIINEEPDNIEEDISIRPISDIENLDDLLEEFKKIESGEKIIIDRETQVLELQARENN